MVKQQEIWTTADEIDEGIVNYFQVNFIEDVHISQVVDHRNKLFMNYSG